jgi:glycerol-3-phosphate acyltransferase PlsY
VTIEFAAAAIIGYALGCISFANLVARRKGVEDLREVGDRNPGYWNARERLGVKGAVPILLLDAAKGGVAVGAGLALAGDVSADALVAVAGTAEHGGSEDEDDRADGHREQELDEGKPGGVTRVSAHGMRE